MCRGLESCLLAVLALGPGLGAEGTGPRQAPYYSASSIVNAASNALDALAPYTFATIYGSDLAYSTRAISPEDIRGGRLPTELAGVRILFDSIPAIVYYVSPVQVNVLIPSMLRRPEVELQLTLDGRAGPAVAVKLLEIAPALFQADAKTVVATRSDWSLITPQAPARPGEDISLFGTGLGNTEPEIIYGQVPQTAARIRRWQEFQVLLEGAPVDSGRISYVGVAPQLPGLYQINLKLPDKLANDPEIRIALAGQISPAGLRLPVRGEQNQSTSAQQ